MNKKLDEIFQRMFAAFGPQHWWPGESPFEVMVGAVLTQNTNWGNVERAIGRLKQEGILSPQAIYEIPLSLLSLYIQSAGYYNIKAGRLKNLVSFFVEEYEANTEKMFTEDTETLRQKLLAIKGIGPETADSILLYAGHKPAFVVDAYTQRVMSRHLLTAEDTDYEELRAFFMDRLPRDAALFNEFHALFVKLGKTYCKKNIPLCQDCPLNGL
ncbi:MAG: endonuclease III domain-containing protein [Deltaproteobacteria bacterium]|nr:endonuclease III domain-containing protein [Deltaproteobacteria bacterium]